MSHAAITGWGMCMPPAVLSNHDLATFLDTDDAWIMQRTGIRERRITHVLGSELAHVAASRALACAGLDAKDLDLIVYGSCSAEESVPNTASGLQLRLGALNAAAMDLNTACTSFLYGLSAATGMIRAGTVKNALIIGVETISPFMDWENRNVAVLFGDGCAAVVLQASERAEGVIADKLGCYADARAILRVRGHGTTYANRQVTFGDTIWDFDGQEIFKRAVHGMGEASAYVLTKARVPPRSGRPRRPAPGERCRHESSRSVPAFRPERVYVTVQTYGNMIRGHRFRSRSRRARPRPKTAARRSYVRRCAATSPAASAPSPRDDRPRHDVVVHDRRSLDPAQRAHFVEERLRRHRPREPRRARAPVRPRGAGGPAAARARRSPRRQQRRRERRAAASRKPRPARVKTSPASGAPARSSGSRPRCTATPAQCRRRTRTAAARRRSAGSRSPCPC